MRTENRETAKRGKKLNIIAGKSFSVSTLINDIPSDREVEELDLDYVAAADISKEEEIPT